VRPRGSRGTPGCWRRASLEDLGDGRTRVVTTALFHTVEERDGMLSAGMEQGMVES
jgi:hypothetical protein